MAPVLLHFGLFHAMRLRRLWSNANLTGKMLKVTSMTCNLNQTILLRQACFKWAIWSCKRSCFPCNFPTNHQKKTTSHLFTQLFLLWIAENTISLVHQSMIKKHAKPDLMLHLCLMYPRTFACAYPAIIKSWNFLAWIECAFDLIPC